MREDNKKKFIRRERTFNNKKLEKKNISIVVVHFPQ